MTKQEKHDRYTQLYEEALANFLSSDDAFIPEDWLDEDEAQELNKIATELFLN